MYSAPGLSIEQLAQSLSEWLMPQGYETQVLPAPGGMVLQARQTESWVQKNGVALNVQMLQQGDNIQVDVGTSKWALQAASGVAAAIIFWPLLALPAYAAYKQKQIIDATWQYINQYVASGGQVGVAPMPFAPVAAPASARPTPAAAAASIKCPQCGEPVKTEARFCANCGAKMQVECPECGATLRADAKFCDSCGAKVKPA
jgi:predicted RNA-binding Zn-ribbon protein involved in translation (DUF1610 family)